MHLTSRQHHIKPQKYSVKSLCSELWALTSCFVLSKRSLLLSISLQLLEFFHQPLVFRATRDPSRKKTSSWKLRRLQEENGGTDWGGEKSLTVRGALVSPGSASLWKPPPRTTTRWRFCSGHMWAPLDLMWICIKVTLASFCLFCPLFMSLCIYVCDLFTVCIYVFCYLQIWPSHLKPRPMGLSHSRFKAIHNLSDLFPVLNHDPRLLRCSLLGVRAKETWHYSMHPITLWFCPWSAPVGGVEW